MRTIVFTAMLLGCSGPAPLEPNPGPPKLNTYTCDAGDEIAFPSDAGLSQCQELTDYHNRYEVAGRCAHSERLDAAVCVFACWGDAGQEVCRQVGGACYAGWCQPLELP